MTEKTRTGLYLPKFCVVPLQAREDKTLNDAAKIYLGELNVLTNKFDYLTYSDKQLAEMKEVSVRTIKNYHKDLEDRGFIRRQTWKEHYKNLKGNGVLIRSKRKLYVIESPSKKVAEGQEAAPRSGGQEAAPRSGGQEVAPIKELTLNTELTDNNRPPAQEAAQAVVVFPILNELKIPKKLKVKISSEHDEETASKLVQRVKAWTARGSDALACNTILDQWETWEDVYPAAQDPKPKEFLGALDPSIHSSFALLVGLVGKTEAEQCWMRAIRNDYDPEPVVRYCLKNDDTVKSPIKVISAAIRDKTDYTKKQNEKNNNDKPKSTVIKYDPNKVEVMVNFGEVMESIKWAEQNSIDREGVCPVELIKKWKESQGNR